MTSERIDELLALAALGELTDADERELDALLADDSAVADELGADLSVAAALQQQHAEQPSAHLKGDIMAAIADLEQLPPAPTNLAPPADMPAAAAPDVSSLDRAREQRRSRWQPLAAAAAAVLLVAGGVFVASNRADAPGPIDAVVQAEDAVSRSFEGTLGGELDVVFSAELDSFVIEGSDVPVVTDAETYQLWLVDAANGVRSVGLFRPDSNGTVAMRFDGFDPSEATVAITLEPAAGSDSPSEPILATA